MKENLKSSEIKKYSKSEENIFLKNLIKIGYSKNLVKKNNHYKKILINCISKKI